MKTRYINKNTLLLFVVFIHMHFSTNTASSQSNFIEEEHDPLEYVESWTGLDMSPHATYRIFNLFINIIYDQTPYIDSFNYDNNIWNHASIEGVNNQAIPSYLSGPHPDLYDPDLNPGNIHGNITRKYYESSLGCLILLGDYVVVNILQSHIPHTGATVPYGFSKMQLLGAAVALIKSNGDLTTLFNHNSFSQYDYDGNRVIDFTQFIIRNSHELYGGFEPGQGESSSYSVLNFTQNGITYNIGKGSVQCIGIGDESINYNGIIQHEFSHRLFGGNNFHISGGAMWKYEGGVTFLGIQGGYGLMGGGNSGLIACNGYERWRMHWKSPVFNSTQEYIVANNQTSDITQRDGNKTFLLRDFVTTGDAIRIKLPYKDQNGLNQYIWLENHKVGINDKLDFLIWSDNPCRPQGKPGIYAYYQIGKDILAGERTIVYPSLQADNLKIISAEGNFDYIRQNTFNTTCVGSGQKQSGLISDSNPFLGYNDVMVQGEDLINDSLQKIEFDFIWRKIYTNNTFTDSIPHLMSERNPFRGNGVINLCSNPSSSNTYTYYNSTYPNHLDDYTPTKPDINTRNIYLSGLSISYIWQPNDDYLVNISWNDYNVNMDVRWCGSIINKEELHVINSAEITFDQSRTPNQKYRDPISGQFSTPTVFTCESGSKLNLHNKSQIQLLNKSSIVLKAGSKTVIEDESSITVNSGCSLRVEPCAILTIKEGGRLIVEEGGILCISEGAMVYINGNENIILNQGYSYDNCLPITPSNIEDLLLIQPHTVFPAGQTLWEGKTYGFSEDLIVPAGVELDIRNSKLSFTPDSKIIVQPNGNLILNQTHVTNSNSSCPNSLWYGIEVWGTSNMTQNPPLYQGKIRLLNGTVIENAKIGILVSKRVCGFCDQQVPGFSGGIVWCDSAYFINNKVAVHFAPYSFYNNSYFSRTNFLTNSNMIQGEQPDCFLKLLHVNLITINGCTFKNTCPVSNQAQSYLNRGIGIFSFNSRFLVKEACLSNISPCTSLRQSVFEKLYRGIYAINSGSSHSPFITNTFFFDNLKGLYLSGFNGVSFATVTKSKFRVIRPNYYTIDSTYGMYLDQSSGFHIEQNDFYSGMDLLDCIGLIVNNSYIRGSDNNEPSQIYRNTFSNLKFGSIAQNANKNPKDGSGLCYKCNKFIDNKWDIQVTKDPGAFGLSSFGLATNQISPAEPAGNMFDWTPVSNHYDLYNDNGMMPFTYFFHNGQNNSEFRLNPTGYTFGNIYLTPEFLTFSEEVNCPSTIEGSGNLNMDYSSMASAQSKADSLNSLLTALIDGGSTQNLSDAVESSTPPEALAVRADLLSKSPWVSDSVVGTSITKEDVLDNAMIRDVMVANTHSAKNDSLISMLETRTVPMPDYMMAQILQGGDSISAKEELEAQRAYWKNQHSVYYHSLIQNYRSDSVNIALEDSLVNLLIERSSPESYYDLAAWYCTKSDFSLSRNILNSIPAIFSLNAQQQEAHQNYLTIFEILEQVQTDTSGLMNLDSSQTVSLQNIVLQSTGLPGVFARNLLSATGKITYNEPVFIGEDNLKSTKREKYRGVKPPADIPRLKVYPNPATDYFIVEYHLGSEVGNNILTISDVDGRIISSYLLNNAQDQVVIPALSLLPGVYILSLKDHNLIIETLKMTIIK